MIKARVFFLGLCLLLSSFIPIGQAFAVSMDLVQGVVGSTATIYSLTSGQTYTIVWDSITYSSGVVSSSGAISYTVPETYGGSHTIQVQSPSGTQVFTSYFTVLPSISISSNTGIVGSTITVTGKGFGASETSLQILFDSTSAKTGITADSNGSWSASFTAPASHAGTHTIDASGYTTLATSVADKTFTIKPAITIGPSSCGVGCAVTVTGSGFTDTETSISIIFDSTAIKTGITADSNGAWSTTFNVPRTYSGSHTVDSSGATTVASDITDISFTVISGITIDKTTGSVGDVVIVTGTDFGVNESGIYVTLDGINQGSGTSADVTGQWKASLTIPATVNGTHTIGAYTSVTAATSGKDLMVLAKIILSPLGGNVDDTVTINGTGFGGGKNISVTFGTATVVSNATTDSSGSFVATFKAPKGINGDVKVTATDTNTISANSIFAMDKTAPPVPQIKSPVKDSTVGFIGETKVEFKWAEVTDPSGVTYAIQVATDSDFKDKIIEHSGMTAIEYKSDDSESLPQGQYFWRVRATDGANNASDWSAKIEFKSGLISVMAIIIIAIIVVALVALRIRAISRH